VALARGSLARADEFIRRGIDILAGIHDDNAVSECLSHLGCVACERGDLTGAVSLCRKARHLALGDPPGRNFTALTMLVQASAVLRGSSLQSPKASALRSAATLLGRGRALISRPGWMRLGARAALLTAELALHLAATGQGTPAVAQAAIETALQQATGEQLVRDEALARCLLGQCALLGGDPECAGSHLRAALHLQTEMGVALEAARTRMVLAATLMASTERRDVVPKACALLADAQAQFAASGAALDLAQAEQLAMAWAAR
jgi:hypothetical protein